MQKEVRRQDEAGPVQAAGDGGGGGPDVGAVHRLLAVSRDAIKGTVSTNAEEFTTSARQEGGQ